MVGKHPLRDPLAPVLRRSPHPLLGRRPALGWLQLRPRQGNEGGVAFRHPSAYLRRAALDTQTKVRVQAKRQLARPVRIVSPYRVVTDPVKPPRCLVSAVAEHGLADDRQVDRPTHALHGAEQAVLSIEIRRRTVVRLRPILDVVPRPHCQRITNDEPTRPRLPGRLHHETPGQIASSGRHLHPPGAEPETTGGPIQDRG